jgi:hypothetical protein
MACRKAPSEQSRSGRGLRGVAMGKLERMGKMKPSEALEKFEYELSRRNLTTKNYIECMKQVFKFIDESKRDGKMFNGFDTVAMGWVSRLQ